jgi:hypothetical protein
MAEERDDYAVAAAREWFAGTKRYVDGIEDDPRHPITKASAQAYYDDAVQQLAAIIRKHVDEYKYQHSWNCTDEECCPQQS